MHMFAGANSDVALLGTPLFAKQALLSSALYLDGCDNMVQVSEGHGCLTTYYS